MIWRIVANLAWYFSFIRMMFHYSLLMNASNPIMFFKATWTFLTSVHYIQCSFTLMPNCFAIDVWSMVILSLQMTIWIHPSFVDSQVWKIPPIGLVVELFSEEQISFPNWVTLPTSNLWIPSNSTITFFDSPLL
jgi:hypothetical protein